MNKSNRTPTSPVTTTNTPKWWNSWWKTKSHSKDGEHRKSSIVNGDIFSEDVCRHCFLSLCKYSILF